MVLASVMFFISLAGLAGFLGLKEWEVRSGRIALPAFRTRLDRWAFLLNDLLVALRADAEKIPPEVVHLSRILLHELALLVGTSLHFLAQQAHRLADFVSHKRNFVRRAPRSEFLKKITEHKNSDTQMLDTEEEREQNS
ncbi:hypothetical protein A2853_01680 [Candidatus Kaiserbacteria bacterium RIFCSPHIGHO2_01_FULL_55_17]|uniref:Uncharacterized protein n=1 Tax=Candidatus Kaiserbacteria bacterium RIFCSPHIGHO2_01_FULL_55_17 TaxID=1798484 RepID=A0A1F6D803_9BACT|nr:MAG: hypothetical protein A2853_01680 [Candidatus Kaiserbacteria bacterium RIFCSPHIGHO2_01_FULL_55_17]